MMKRRTATIASSAILAILALSPLGAYAISNPLGSSTAPTQAPTSPPVSGVLDESDIFYGNTAGSNCPTTMYSYDPSTDTHASYTLTSTSGDFCNGRAMAWDGANLWYSVVAASAGSCPFGGDGFIHKVAPTGGADIAKINDPYGPCGQGIGAMKFDAPLSAGGHLWIESYLPTLSGIPVLGNNCSPSTACLVQVSEIDVSTDTVLASCTLPFRDGGAGSDTFSLFTGNEFATDGGEILTTLYFYQEPSTVNAGSCVQVGAPVPTQGATGLNFASNGDCIYTDGSGTTYNGGSNCDSVLASTTNGFPISEEDITCTTLPATGSLCSLPHPILGAPEFGGPTSAILVTALAMVGVAFLARRKAMTPIAGRP